LPVVPRNTMSSFVICRFVRAGVSGLRTAADQKSAPATCIRPVLLQLVKSFAMDRAKANVNPPKPIPQIAGVLIRVFRDIGRIFSLLVLLIELSLSAVTNARKSPGACHSPKREPRPSAQWRGLGTLVYGFLARRGLEGSVRETYGRARRSSWNFRHKQPVGHAFLKVSDYRCLSPGDRDRERLACGRSESMMYVPSFFGPQIMIRFLLRHLRPLLPHLPRTPGTSLGPLRSRRLRRCRSSSVADGSLRRSISWPAIARAFASLPVRTPVRWVLGPCSVAMIDLHSLQTMSAASCSFLS